MRAGGETGRAASFTAWAPALRALADAIGDATRAARTAAHDAGDPARLARTVGQGVGDVTFALDVPSEEVLDGWLTERGREGPLSLLTEDRGWRHVGPGIDGAPVELEPFDHEGPRIVVDPIDGTRNLFADLRPAWTAIAFALGERGRAPRMDDVTGGLLAELPPTRARTRRVLVGQDERPCLLDEHDTSDGRLLGRRELRVDEDARCERGYFPFFRYDPAQRPALARLEAEFFARLERDEGADTSTCWDDQTISNSDQLVLLTLGTYRTIVDARALVAARSGEPATTSKPYDVAAAIACARAAGAVVVGADGEELDFPLDATTPVHFAGFANEHTHARLAPHLVAAVAEVLA